MNLNEILDQLEDGTPARQLITGSKQAQGLGEAFFARISTYYGTENVKLKRLGRHWKSLLKRVDDPAWVYRGGGGYERAIGNWMASASAFISAGNAATDSVSRHAFQVGAVDSLARAGRIEEAHRLAESLSESLNKLGESALAGRALLNLGNALIYQERMDEAREILGRALSQLTEDEYPLEVFSTKLGLSSAHLYSGDPRIAEGYALEIISGADQLGAEYLRDLARLNLALALNVTNRAEEAYRLLLELRDSLSDSPVDLDRVGEYLGDALFQLNLWDEAELAYSAVLSSSKALIPLHRANLMLGLGQALAAQGRFAQAKSPLIKAVNLYASLGNPTWQGVAIIQLARIDVASGRRALAVQQLLDAEALTAKAPYYQAQVLLELSRLGEDRLAKVQRLVNRYGYSGLIWQIHYLKALGSSSPGPHYRRMFAAIVSGRLTTGSVAARLGFFKDKTDAVQAYLGWLLSSPTAARVAEARRAIEQARSATLIDEILQTASLPADVAERLRRVRDELQGGDEEAPKGGARRTEGPRTSMAAAQKAATEGLLFIDLAVKPYAAATSTPPIVIETSAGTRVLSANRSHTLGDLDEALRWLSYELLAPMANPNAKPGPALDLLRRLSDIFAPMWQSGADRVCPDGASWRVPWSVCSQLAGVDREWALAIHPFMDATYEGPLTPWNKCAVWLGSSPDLRFADREAEAIISQFHSCPVLRSAEEVRTSLQQKYEVVHVVSHATHRPQNPMLSSLEFPDGPVYAYEIARSDLRVKLATLSACETGAISIATRSEPDGLARAFIARGAQSVVASQWPLDDEAAFVQFDSLYKSLIAGRSVREALSISRTTAQQWREHPYFWGPLVLYAGYRHEKAFP